MSFPLQQARLCLDCEFVFAGGSQNCVKCGSQATVWLNKYIKSLKEATEKVGRIGENNEKNTKDLIRNNDYTGRVL